jgi:hypothetical protein
MHMVKKKKKLPAVIVLKSIFQFLIIRNRHDYGRYV